MTWLVIHASSQRLSRISRRHLVRFLTIGAAPALVVCSPRRPSHLPSGGQDTRPVVVGIDAPAGADTRGVEWMKVTIPRVGSLRAAVARPQGVGPFRTLVLLHGTHGFAEEYVSLAQEISRHGILAVAACWFSGGTGLGTRFVTPIECPEAPPMPRAASADAIRTLDALVQAVRMLPDVRPDHLALFGHSRGGGAALHYVLGGGAVQAVVLNSAGYPHELTGRVGDLRVPILILHGTADGPADGGSALTRVEMARTFEASLRQAGKQVEAKYYEGGHNSIFSDSAQYHDEVQQIVAFLARELLD